MALSSIQLEAFLVLAQTRNFTRAASKLNVTQSAFSQRILNLEEELETTLFIRERAGVKLTEIAQVLLQYCKTKELLEDDFLARVKSRSTEDLRGVVRVAAFSSVARSVVLPALAPLLAKHPNLQLELSTREMRELPELLKRGEVDFIVTTSDYIRDDIESTHLADELNVLVERKGYKGPDVYLDHDEQDPTTFNYMKLAKRKVTKLERRYLDDVYGILDGVRLGIGRAVIPLHMLKGVEGLKVIQPETILRIPVVLHWYRQPYYPRLHSATQKTLVTSAKSFLDI